MELVYLWVEKYKNIENEGFNFSPRFRCEYDKEKNELEIIDKNETGEFYPKNFFGENINVTSIVGENGSGKSSLLEALYLIPKIEEKKIFYVYTLDYNTFFYSTNFDFLINSSTVKLDKKNVQVCYLGLSFIPNVQRKILIAKNKEDRPSSIENYKIEFIQKFTDIFKDNNEILKKINDRFIFDKLKITLFRSQLISREKLIIQKGLGALNTESHHEEYEKILNMVYDKIEKLIESAITSSKDHILTRRLKLSQMKDSSKDLPTDIKISFFINYVDNLSSLFSDITNIKYISFDDANNIFDELSFDNLFEKINEFEEKINIHNIHFENIQMNIKLVKELIEFCKVNSPQFRIEDNNFFLTLKLDNPLIEKILDLRNLFTVNVEDNTYSLLDIELLSYEYNVDFFGLSSGEQKRLSLYIEIIYAYLFSESKILLLDEPDTFLHPQWSKLFINDLLKVIPIVSEKKHLVLTSHSPFILSDLPKENIIFLEKGKQVYPFEDGKQTFGANIHTLLSHGFFMKDGLMGEFAKDKIDTAIKYLNQSKLSDDELSYCGNIISIIGEPIIKRQLQKMLDSKRLSEIEVIKKQIVELQLELLKKENKK